MLAPILLAGSLLLAAPAGAATEGTAPGVGPDHGKAVTGEATPIGGGAWEVELAYAPSLTQPGTGGFERSPYAHAHVLSLALVHGLHADVDVRIGGGVGEAAERTEDVGRRYGFGATDLAMGIRWRFLARTGETLDVAVAATVVAPTGREARGGAPGLTQGHWIVRPALLASRDWGRTTANAEVALLAPVDGDRSFAGATFASLGLGHALLPWLQPMLELSHEAIRGESLRQRLGLAAGLNLTHQSGARLILGVQQAVWGRGLPQTVSGLVAGKLAF